VLRPCSALLLALISLAACGRKASGPLAPNKAIDSFKLSDDFHIELFASEPDVVDPVEMVFDENGRAFVAEMLDLPFDPPPGKPPRGRIRMLEDTDGDGKADKSTIFAEQMLQCSGLMPWKGGIIATSSPNIYYLKDTDGDGKADVRKILFTGFSKGDPTNPEGEVTNPRLAIDNWIYFSNSGRSGRITSPEYPKLAPVQVRGADFRYHPIKGLAEAASGPAQFGSTFDDWGNRFVSQNTLHLRHVVVPMNYLARAPLLTVPAVMRDVYDYAHRERRMFPLTGPQEWRVIRTEMRQKRFQENKQKRVEHAAGYITGAAGSTVYSGDAFPENYRGTIFTGDVSGNLVRHDIVKPEGVSFTARPAKDGVEFLASTDQWFRPTMFVNAPDGLLYITDMYREVIETPLSIPDELKKSINFYSGDTLGRIWRIVPNQPARKRDLRPNLGAASTSQLVKELENTNGWHSSTAHRLLIERQDRAAVPLLKDIAQNSASAQARLRALWIVEGLSALDEPLVLRALEDNHPRIREHAIRLSESLPQTRTLAAALLGRKQDSDPRVQFQLAFTLGNWKDARARGVLADLAVEHGADPWFRAAILSSTAEAPVDLLNLILARKPDWQEPRFLSMVGSLVGARQQPAEIQHLLALTARFQNPQHALNGLADGLKLAGVSHLPGLGVEAPLEKFLSSPGDEVQKAAWRVARFFELRNLVRKASQEALSESVPVARRVSAVGALRGAQYSVAAPVLKKVLETPSAAPALQAAGIEALSAFDSPEVAPVLLSHWKSYSPEARSSAMAALIGQRNRVPVLLEALEQERVEMGAVEMNVRNRLIEDSDPKIAERARKLFQHAGGDRAKVVAAYSDVAKLAGDVGRGKKVFEDNCARCHMPRRQGGRIGADLSGINMKSKQELLESILNPSASIESRYVNYLVTTRDGRMYDGVLGNETPGAVTLRGGAEEDITILRKNIVEIRASSISLMPEDLEKSMSKQDIADVIAYLVGGL
jgi:putative membrane-bound dehydrogenase-like protein